MRGLHYGIAAASAGGLGLLVWWWLRDPSDGDVARAGEDMGTEDPTSPDDPTALAIAAGVSISVYAHARAIASESGGQPYAAQVAVGWAIRNYADAHKGGDIVRTVLGSASVFGKQGSGGRGYVASTRAPGAAQLEMARRIQAGKIGDPTGGATNFDSPREQAREYAAGIVRKTPEQVADERIAEGLVAYDVEVAGADFRFWGPA